MAEDVHWSAPSLWSRSKLLIRPRRLRDEPRDVLARARARDSHGSLFRWISTNIITTRKPVSRTYRFRMRSAPTLLQTISSCRPLPSHMMEVLLHYVSLCVLTCILLRFLHLSFARPALIALQVDIYECWALIQRSRFLKLESIVVPHTPSLIEESHPT